MDSLTFLNPVPPSLVDERPLAPRLDRLDGHRLGLLDNRKTNAGGLLDRVGTGLAERHPDLEIVTEQKLASAAAPAEVIERLQTCHAVLLAIAD